MTDGLALTTSPLLVWQFPELEQPPRSAPKASASEPQEPASDPAPALEPEHAGLEEPSISGIVQERIAAGYAEGWRQGFTEGSERGYADGIETGTKEAEAALASQAQSLAAIVARLSAPILALDRQVEEAVAALALEAARCVIGSETSHSREYLVPLIREAVAKVPIEMGTLKVVLNPAELEVIRALAPEIENGSVLFVGDEAIGPGDCLVVADGQGGPIKDMRWRPRTGEGMSQVDLSLATRWRAVMLALFEGEDK